MLEFLEQGCDVGTLHSYFETFTQQERTIKENFQNKELSLLSDLEQHLQHFLHFKIPKIMEEKDSENEDIHIDTLLKNN